MNEACSGSIRNILAGLDFSKLEWQQWQHPPAEAGPRAVITLPRLFVTGYLKRRDHSTDYYL